jgi:hypothetical protein
MGGRITPETGASRRLESQRRQGYLDASNGVARALGYYERPGFAFLFLPVPGEGLDVVVVVCPIITPPTSLGSTTASGTLDDDELEVVVLNGDWGPSIILTIPGCALDAFLASLADNELNLSCMSASPINEPSIPTPCPRVVNEGITSPRVGSSARIVFVSSAIVFKLPTIACNTGNSP